MLNSENASTQSFTPALDTLQDQKNKPGKLVFIAALTNIASYRRRLVTVATWAQTSRAWEEANGLASSYLTGHKGCSCFGEAPRLGLKQLRGDVTQIQTRNTALMKTTHFKWARKPGVGIGRPPP